MKCMTHSTPHWALVGGQFEIMKFLVTRRQHRSRTALRYMISPITRQTEGEHTNA